MSYFSYIYKNGKLLYKINKPFKFFRGNKTPSHYVYDSNNKIIGSIMKNGFKPPAKLSFKNSNFECYLVGLGDKGIKFVIFNSDKNIQIALIELGIKIYDNKAKYELFAENENYMEIAIISNLFYDFIRFDFRNNSVSKGVTITKVYTKNKAFLSKYNPSFKENILGRQDNQK